MYMIHLQKITERKDWQVLEGGNKRLRKMKDGERSKC